MIISLTQYNCYLYFVVLYQFQTIIVRKEDHSLNFLTTKTRMQIPQVNVCLRTVNPRLIHLESLKLVCMRQKINRRD